MNVTAATWPSATSSLNLDGRMSWGFWPPPANAMNTASAARTSRTHMMGPRNTRPKKVSGRSVNDVSWSGGERVRLPGCGPSRRAADGSTGVGQHRRPPASGMAIYLRKYTADGGSVLRCAGDRHTPAEWLLGRSLVRGRLQGGHVGQVAEAFGVVEAVPDDELRRDLEPDVPELHVDLLHRGLVQQRAHLERRRSPRPQVLQQVCERQP